MYIKQSHLYLFLLKVHVHHTRGVCSASVPGSGYRRWTQSAHLWLEYQHVGWATFASALCLATNF